MTINPNDAVRELTQIIRDATPRSVNTNKYCDILDAFLAKLNEDPAPTVNAETKCPRCHHVSHVGACQEYVPLGQGRDTSMWPCACVNATGSAPSVAVAAPADALPSWVDVEVAGRTLYESQNDPNKPNFIRWEDIANIWKSDYREAASNLILTVLRMQREHDREDEHATDSVKSAPQISIKSRCHNCDHAQQVHNIGAGGVAGPCNVELCMCRRYSAPEPQATTENHAVTPTSSKCIVCKHTAHIGPCNIVVMTKHDIRGKHEEKCVCQYDAKPIESPPSITQPKVARKNEPRGTERVLRKELRTGDRLIGEISENGEFKSYTNSFVYKAEHMLSNGLFVVWTPRPQSESRGTNTPTHVPTVQPEKAARCMAVVLVGDSEGEELCGNSLPCKTHPPTLAQPETAGEIARAQGRLLCIGNTKLSVPYAVVIANAVNAAHRAAVASRDGVDPGGESPTAENKERR